MTEPRARGTVLLAVGAAVGITVAAAGLLRGAGGGLPPGAVAQVNGWVIDAEEYARMLAAVAGDRREGLGEVERRRVLDRFIDEELLVQRGLELGLAQQDVKVRRTISAAVIDAVVAEAETVEPSEGELEAFYAAERDFFARSDRVRVRQVWVRAATGDGAAARARATEAAGRLRAGEPFAAVRGTLGDPEPVPLPDALLPPAKLIDYVGPTALRTALALDVGAVSDPIHSSSGYHVLEVVEREPPHVPPLAEIRGEVAAEFRRRAGDRALRAYLDDLRRRADVRVAPP